MVLRGWELGYNQYILIHYAAPATFTNHPRCIFTPDCFIVWLMYVGFVDFPKRNDEPTLYPQVVLVPTLSLNPGVMWR